MTTVRVFGDKLGIDDCFVDATVDNIDLEGVVKLVDVDSSRSWKVELSDLQSWMEKDYVAEHKQIAEPSNDVWTAIQSVHGASTDSVHASIEYDLQSCAEESFKHVMSAQTS